jgi:hypothetical protein
MALATTLATTPVLQWLTAGRLRLDQPAEGS